VLLPEAGQTCQVGSSVRDSEHAVRRMSARQHSCPYAAVKSTGCRRLERRSVRTLGSELAPDQRLETADHGIEAQADRSTPSTRCERSPQGKRLRRQRAIGIPCPSVPRLERLMTIEAIRRQFVLRDAPISRHHTEWGTSSATNVLLLLDIGIGTLHGCFTLLSDDRPRRQFATSTESRIITRK
jgi:hypothetical protein